MKKELLEEIERLKTEIWKLESKRSGFEYFLLKENTKLKRLILHLFERVAEKEAAEWEQLAGAFFPNCVSKASKMCKHHEEQWSRIAKKCGDEYRKMKAELIMKEK